MHLCRLRSILKVEILLILLLILMMNQCQGIKWLGISLHPRNKSDETTPFTQQECRKLRDELGFNKRQLAFCMDWKTGFAMHAVLKAAQAVVYYCPVTFQDRRWNCSHIYQLPKIPTDMQRNFKERAVIHAFSSAALLFEISRRCAKSLVTHCSCESNGIQYVGDSQERFVYGGCADNTRVGREYAMQFLGFHKRWTMFNKKRPKKDRKRKRNRRRRPSSEAIKTRKERRRARQEKKFMDYHNYEAGIEILNSNKEKKCKCHGVSGSCEQKTCVDVLIRFDDARAQALMKKHYVAARISKLTDDNILRAKLIYFLKTPYGVNAMQIFNQTVNSTDLVSKEDSPDFCRPDQTSGSDGTKGRNCVTDPNEELSNHCSKMCCGRGYHSIPEVYVDEICKCSFSNRFQCTSCKKKVTRHYCL